VDNSRPGPAAMRRRTSPHPPSPCVWRRRWWATGPARAPTGREGQQHRRESDEFTLDLLLDAFQRLQDDGWARPKRNGRGFASQSERSRQARPTGS